MYVLLQLSSSRYSSYFRITSARDHFVKQITAHFLNFVAYSESTVLKGNTNTEPEDDAEIIPALQNKSVISVVLGDYHSAALTSDGKLYTWGSFSRGALGLGLPEELPVGAPGGYGTQEHLDCARQSHLNRVSPVPDVEVPTQVHFDHGEKKQKERFCFAAAAAGWHTGALVIDMNPEVSRSCIEQSQWTPLSFPPLGRRGRTYRRAR